MAISKIVAQTTTMLLPNDIINSTTGMPTSFSGSATYSDGTTSFYLDCNNLLWCLTSEILSFGAIGGWTTFNLQSEGSLICATTNTGGLHQLGSGTASCAQTHLLADSHREPDLTSYESHTYTVIFTNIDSAVAAALATTPQPVPTPVPYQVKPTIASISLPGTGEISTTSTATASASSDSFQHPLSSSSSTKIGAGVGVSLGVLALGVVGLLAFRRRMSKRKKPKGPSELYFNDAGTRQVEAAGIEGGEITKGSK